MINVVNNTEIITKSIMMPAASISMAFEKKNPENSRKGEINRGHIGLVIVSKVRALMEPSV